ncbi:sodium:alanine symporter family protein [Deltaproteobacteria bacterium Smac51]|nr:sodium:alanine symporter family protein [Deltaproteobacteria bacterium Smac51]
MVDIISNIGGYLWGPPMVVTIIFCGLFLTIRAKFFSIRHFGHAFSYTLGKEGRKESNDRSHGNISPFEAICIAVGGAVGVGAIGGVAAAIAVGGPGAVFWMWVWGFFGMSVKMVEVALASYYRSKDERGNYYGGPSYYMQKGLGWDKGWKVGGVLAVCFGVTFLANAFSASQVFTISEALNTSFGIPRIPIAAAYTAFILYLVWRGVPRIAKFASKCVPFMCLLYLTGGIILMIMNYENLPWVIENIFVHAFTPMSATGGFVGAGVMTIIRTGVARSINSNEAGQGSSPMIHASASTVHPIRQGLWGGVEVFIDTMLVCTITALAVLCTGTWNSGLTAATLTISAFESGFGIIGVYFIGLITFLFGITTTTGWFSYYSALVAHAFEKHPDIKYKALFVFKLIFPWPNVIIVTLFVVTGHSANLFWAIIDILTVLPTFFNVIAISLLSGVFVKLLNDYKARYMGIGQVDPNFHVFYEDKLAHEAKGQSSATAASPGQRAEGPATA